MYEYDLPLDAAVPMPAVGASLVIFSALRFILAFLVVCFTRPTSLQDIPPGSERYISLIRENYLQFYLRWIRLAVTSGLLNKPGVTLTGERQRHLLER